MMMLGSLHESAKIMHNAHETVFHKDKRRVKTPTVQDQFAYFSLTAFDIWMQHLKCWTKTISLCFDDISTVIAAKGGYFV